MPVSVRLRVLRTQDQSEDTTVAWPATRLLGLLAERHFVAVVEALEGQGVCDELRAWEEALATLQGDPGVVGHEG